MRSIRIITLLAGLMLAFAIGASGQTFVAGMDGAQEVPPSGSAAIGYGTVVLNPAQTMITVNMGFSGLGTAASAAHIHTAPAGSNGGVTFGLTGVPAATSGVIPSQTFAVTPSQVTDLMTGQMYFNVHTAGFGGGEIRGQIVAASCTTAGPIEVEATAGTIIPTAYATLNAAFAAINAGTHQGAITLEVCGDTAEGTATATLNASGAGAALYTSIGMFPVGGVARTISGGTTAGLPLIDFSGADNVTIDGLNTGGNSLTIANTTSPGTSGTSTIRFIAGATNNTITNSNLQGSKGTSVATNGAVVTFSTDAVTASGNDNNTISNNNIGPAGANLPTTGIQCNGSTTTTAIGNSGLVINNNNIFDFFGAAVTSAGVAVNGGCNTFSITNNRFYQTATRTQTTAALHTPILMNSSTATSGVQGMTITGNIIGYSSNTQTGTYALTGAVAATFRGISFSGITGGTVSNINSNTVASVSMTGVTSSGTSTSSPFMGIYISNGNGITNSNTIGSQSATGSLTFSSGSASAGDVIAIHSFASDAWTVSNNNIGGITAANTSTGAANVYGIRVNTLSTTPATISNNLVGGTVANSLQSTAAAATAGTQVAGIFLSTSIATLTSNTVRNLTAPGGTGTTTTASVIGINFLSATPVNNVAQNTIFNLSNTNATAASIVTGIQFTGGTGNVVERNLIHSLSNATNSATAEVNGIRVGGGTTAYRNNMIAIGAGIPNAIGAAATNAGTTGVNGINEVLGTNTFFHNNVYIGGAPTAGIGASYAFNGTQVTVARSFRDNIFFNARSNSGATGSNYAVKINGTTSNPAGLTINNNLYFANGSGAVFGFFNSLNVANLAAWRTAVGQDAVSFESNPQYNDPTNATPDLHLHPTNATVAEGNGVDVGVVNDFDGQTRAGLTPVDIGADAGNFNGVDLSPPVITYTPLANTSSTMNRTQSVTITDVTGVATGGFAPIIYYRKNAGAYVGATCTLMSGTVNNGVWDCIIVNANVGGVVLGDVITYFVVAQDTLGNLAANPNAGFVGTDVTTISMTPTNPNPYTIVNAVSGSFNVGAGETYTSLTNAGGIFELINNSEVTGNITIDITSDLSAASGTFVAETGTVALNAFASPFTITIKPSGAPRLVNGPAASTALIRLNGASRVTIDGSLSGGTDRSLTIENTSVTTPQVVRFGSIGAAAITANTLRNSIVVNGVNTSSAVVVTDVAGTAGTFNNITVQNNDIQKAFVGVFTNATVLVGNGSGLLITGNKLDTAGVNAIRNVGVYVQGADGATVSNNTIGNFDVTSAENDTGIWLATAAANTTVSGNTVTTLGYTGTSANGPYGIRDSGGAAAFGNSITRNTVSNISTNGTTTVFGIDNSSGGTLIIRNNVQGVANTNTGTFGAYGINITAGNNVVVRNNFVSGVTGNMSGGAAFSTTFGIFGIRIAAGTGHQIYNNSVNLFGLRAGTANSALLTAAFAVVSTASTGMDVRNNVFANNITGGTTSIANVSVYLPSAGTSAMNLTDNKNAYFYGADVAREGAGQAGAIAGTNFFTTLPALAAYSSTLHVPATNDNMSQAFTTAPPFVSNTDLHITDPVSPLLGAADSIGSVTVDIDADPRPGSAPDIGADELVQATAGSFPAGTFYNGVLAGNDVLVGNATITNSMTLTGISATGANTLTLDCNATVSGAGPTNYVDGLVRKNFCDGTPFSFPVGTVGGADPGYSPVVATPVAPVPTVLAPGDLSVDPEDLTLAGLSTMDFVSRNWDLNGSGLTVNLDFTYLAGDANGNSANYQVIRRTGTTNTVICVAGCISGMTASVTAVSSFSRWGVGQLAPTAANATVGGRVTTQTGRGIYQARVVMIDGSGNARVARTNPFGFYRFTDVGTGQTYVFSAFDKRYQFVEPSIVTSVDGDDDGINFVALGGQNDLNSDPTYFEKAPFDFDGDGISDSSVWRADSNSWIVRRSSDNTWYSREFGLATDKLAPADYDGDGRTDFAVFRPSEGNWYLWLSQTNSIRIEHFASAADVPMPSDFDGDGKADLAVWRAGKNVIAVKQSSNGQTFDQTFEKIDEAFIPRIGDYNGDGKADIAVFKQGSRTWEIHFPDSRKWMTVGIDGQGDVPLFADFDGDGRADLGVYNSETGIWTIRQSRSGEVASIQNGGTTDAPVLGDFDGDGRIDAAVFRNGTWSIRQSVTNRTHTREFGLPTDRAIPSTYVK